MKTKVLWIHCAAVLMGVAHLDAATLTLFAGGGSLVTGPATQCRLADPFAIEFDSNGNGFLCEMPNNRVMKIDSSGVLMTIGGTGQKGSAGDDGPAAKAQFNGPHNLAVDKNGDVYIADTWNGKIRRIDAKTGVVSTFAGTGKKAFSGDGGPADKADFSGIYSIAFDAPHENLFAVDLENRRVRAIDMKTKDVRAIAGNGTKGVPAEGSDAVSSPLFDPRAVAVAKSGDVYILERSGNALRVVDAKGKIRTVVGTGKAGPWTPTENPLEATLKGPKHLCVDKDGNVLIADSDNHVIRKYLPKENKLLRVAGTGKAGRGLNSNPLKTELNQPHGVSADAQGRIYICDSLNSRVLKLEP
jgi:DNA-binding beta-propeller fold protein YncE